MTHRRVMQLGGLAITAVTRQWMRTLEYQAAFYDRAVDPAWPGFAVRPSFCSGTSTFRCCSTCADTAGSPCS